MNNKQVFAYGLLLSTNDLRSIFVGHIHFKKLMKFRKFIEIFHCRLTRLCVYPNGQWFFSFKTKNEKQIFICFFYHWSKERLVWEIIWEISIRPNRLISTLVTLEIEWIKLWGWAKWPRIGSSWYLKSVRFCWFITFGLKNLSVNIK